MKAYGNHKETNFRNINFEELLFRKYIPKPLTRNKNHPIIGMDTETYRGYAKLICDSTGKFVYNPSLDECLSFLSRYSLRGKHIFFYNIDFDIQSILKRLPKPFLYALYRRRKVQYKEWYIKYVPKKFFSIRKGRDVYRYYDLWQFFDCSLEEASIKYLHMQKTVTKFRRDDLNEHIEVWKAYRSEIIDYCTQDAILCQKLGHILQNYLIQKIKLIPQSYISKASLSKEYFRKNSIIPSIRNIRSDILRLAFYAYKGGRFELLKKGYFKNVELYDINSAYPYEIRNLIDITKGKWKYTRTLTPSAYYGFYLCQVNIPYQYICPLPYILPNDVLIYPFGNWRTVLTKNEIEQLLTPKQYKIEYGYEFFPTEIVYPFRESINHLSSIKKEADPDSYLYDLAKIIMNALYGCFYEKIKKEDGIHTGKLFNPIYASIITANTRIKVYQFAQQFPQNVIAFATDSVLLRGHQKVNTGSNIGDWSLKACGKAVCIQSGLYLIENQLRTRGFNIGSKIYTPDGVYQNIFSYIQAFPNRKIYTGYIYRPLHIIESLIHTKKYSIDDTNRWIKFQKTLNINREIKRTFTEKFENGGELWKKNIDSSPNYVGDYDTQHISQYNRKKIDVRERKRGREYRISESAPDIDPQIKKTYEKDLEALSEMKSTLKHELYHMEKR